MNVPTELHIIPGYFCNMTCAHCGVYSSPARKTQLTQDDLKIIKKDLLRFPPKRLLFTGGEPTFYIETINDILMAHPNLGDCQIQITTNGWFAKTPKRMSFILESFVQIDHIQLSWDQYHQPILAVEQVKLLYNYCRERNIGFNISVVISDPAELTSVKNIEQEIGCDVIFERMVGCGRAEKNQLRFYYPAFDSAVFNEKCPNLRQVAYHPGRGYSVCCSNLAYNMSLPDLLHRGFSEHIESDFFKKISCKTMGQLVKEVGIEEVELQPRHSHVCELCELIHRKKYNSSQNHMRFQYEEY